jgi:hypothetical protein
LLTIRAAKVRFRQLGRDLAGRTNRVFADLLNTQVEAALAGSALALRSTTADTATRRVLRREMNDVEHRGDNARGSLISELAVALVTPIDREDLFRLSRSVDDVLDNLRDFARELDLYCVADGSGFVALLNEVVEGLGALRLAVVKLRSGRTRLDTDALAVRKHASGVRREYQRELAQLFNGPLTMDVLKQRELLRRLDIVGLRLAEAADALADGTVKRLT